MAAKNILKLPGNWEIRTFSRRVASRRSVCYKGILRIYPYDIQLPTWKVFIIKLSKYQFKKLTVDILL